MSTQAENSRADRDSDARGARTECASVSDAPRLVTRGETPERCNTASNESALVDWLAFTVRPPPGGDRAWLEQSVQSVFCVPREGWRGTGRGWYGYKDHVVLGGLGLLAFGGEAQKGTFHVELYASACARIVDWAAVGLWGQLYDAAITRVDLAHDDLDGGSLDINRAVEWWHAGKFDANGRPPRSEFIDDMGSNHGKTLYVGRRGSGKILRIYEKGKELGDPTSPWVRAEVELRNKGRTVPWEVLTQPGQYLAGAYPALRYLSAQQSRLRTVQRAAQIGYEAMVKNLRAQGGKAVNVMCKVHQGDAAAVVSRLVREGFPKRLAGVPEQAIAALEDSVT